MASALLPSDASLDVPVVPLSEQLNQLLVPDEIENHRYPEKNALITQISFKLSLRAQEMALLRIREVVTFGAQFASGYDIKDVLVLPKSFIKGARAVAANAVRI